MTSSEYAIDAEHSTAHVLDVSVPISLPKSYPVIYFQLDDRTFRLAGKYACVAHYGGEVMRKEVVLIEGEPVSAYSSLIYYCIHKTQEYP